MGFIEFLINNEAFLIKYFTRIIFLLFTSYLTSHNCNEISKRLGYRKKKSVVNKIKAYIIHFLIAFLPFVSWTLTLLFIFLTVNKDSIYTEEYFEKSKEYNR